MLGPVYSAKRGPRSSLAFLAPQEIALGVRERINDNRGITSVIVGIIVLCALALGLRGACSPYGDAGGGFQRAFFSIDDGQTWFPDDASKIPPIEHEGKTAYRVKVFKCPDGKEFVSHLERYNPDAKKRIEAVVRDGSAKSGGAMIPDMELGRALEVKKPGEKKWIRWTPETSEQYTRTMSPKCPDGSANAEPVLPE